MPYPQYPTTYIKGLKSLPMPHPAKPIPETLKTNNLILQFDSGYEQRRKKSPPRKGFELTYPLLEKEAYDILSNFYLAVGGNLDTFSWTHPVSKITYNVRFDMDTFQGEYHTTTSNNTHYWKVSVKLLQVL